MSAKLFFRYGTMNSGKSLHILATAYNFQERKIPFLIVKSSIDTRDEGVIHSRALGDRECIIVNSDERITDAIKKSNSGLTLSDVKWMLVDEAQFLTPDQVDELSDFVDFLEINIICYGLRTDFKSKLFPGSKRLFEIADGIEEIKSSCDCGEKNIINARIDSNGNVVTSGKQIEVGGEDRYLSMCRKCWKEKCRKNINV